MPSAGGNAVPDLQDLALILYFSAGIIKRLKSPGGEINFRAAAYTGALYEIELYIVTGELKNLETGVYHFDPADVSLGSTTTVSLRATDGTQRQLFCSLIRSWPTFLENVHGACSKQDDNCERNQRLDYHADLCPA
jgi:hypothetical protein